MVVLHEFAHGLGFANFIDDATGNPALGLADIYSVFSYDNTQGLYWNQMHNSQRRASAVNTGGLVWRGPAVTADAPGALGGIPVVRTVVPDAGDLAAQPASYGLPVPDPPGLTAEVVLYTDGEGADPNDACECAEIFCDANAPNDTSVSGKIALINRGSCNFSVKSAAAQASGAVGVIITNNQPSGLPPMGGSDVIPPTITSVGISRADGDLLKASLPGAMVTLIADPALGLAGTDAAGFVKLYAPRPVDPGSSVSHFDTTLTPNALMEPFDSPDLVASDLDLTPSQMADIGWESGPHCPVGSSDASEVTVGRCSTGVENHFGPFGFSLGVPRSLGGLEEPPGNAHGVGSIGGCTIQDMVQACVNGTSGTRGCLNHVTQYLEGNGVIGPADTQAILRCAR